MWLIKKTVQLASNKKNVNKSSWITEVVRVEVNLSATSTVIAQFLLQKHNRKMFDLENEGKSNGTQHRQWCPSMAIIKIDIQHYTFCASFSISEILSFQVLDVENLGSVRTVQHSQWCNWIANVSLYERHSTHFTLSLTICETVTFQMIDHENLGQCRGVQHSHCSHAMANINV